MLLQPPSTNPLSPLWAKRPNVPQWLWPLLPAIVPSPGPPQGPATPAPLIRVQHLRGPYATMPTLLDGELGLMTNLNAWGYGYGGVNYSLIPPADFGCRLSLSSTTPISFADVTSATTIYYIPYRHDICWIWDGGKWLMVHIPAAGISVALGTLSNATNYDIFTYLSGTTPILYIGPAWNTGGGSDTVRGTGIGSTAITQKNGILVNTNALISGTLTIPANQATYVGTFRTVSTTQTADFGAGGNNPIGGGSGTTAQRFLWNNYNRVLRPFSITTTSTPSLNSLTPAIWNGEANDKADFVFGFDVETVEAGYTFGSAINTNPNGPQCGFGLDVTNAFSTGSPSPVYFYSTGQNGAGCTYFDASLGLGRHFLAMLLAAASTLAGSTMQSGAANGIRGSSWS